MGKGYNPIVFHFEWPDVPENRLMATFRQALFPSVVKIVR